MTDIKGLIGKRVLVRTRAVPVFSDVYECEVEEISPEHVKLTDTDGDSCWHRPENVEVVEVLRGLTAKTGY